MQTSSPTIDRRRFLQIAGGVAAGVALTGSLEGCAGVPNGASILEYASLAPSSHNTQPWSLLVLAAGHWRITADPARRLPGIDAAGRESVVSLGTFLENVDRAAASFGYEVETTVTGETTAALVVDVRLHTTTPRGEDLSPLKRRRTVRQLSERPVPREVIEQAILAAGTAPNGANMQPWKFVVVQSPDRLTKLRNALPFGKINAPCAIVVCSDLRSITRAAVDRFWVQDCSAATQNILLAATSMGLGACWCGVHPIKTIERTIRKTLDIPLAVFPFNVIFVGHPTEEKPARTQFSEKNVFSEKFGNLWEDGLMKMSTPTKEE